MEQVNIILATYQGEKYIKEQLDSILNSTFTDFIVSVYDDGSKDRTLEIVEGYVKKYPNRIQLFCNKSNQGHFNNFMQGVIANPHPYIMFCDQDDIWNSDKIKDTYECMIRAEKQHKEETPIAVFTDATVVDENLNVLNESFHKAGNLDTKLLDLPHMLMENKIMGCTMMMNRALIEKVVSLPKQARFHDWWLALIAAAYGKIIYLPKATMKYRQHGNNVVGNVSFAQYIRNRVQNLSKQRKAIKETIQQAEDFYSMYENSLPDNAKHMVQQFAAMKTAGFIKRRQIVLKNKFFKTGLVRNLGLMFLL